MFDALAIELNNRPASERRQYLPGSGAIEIGLWRVIEIFLLHAGVHLVKPSIEPAVHRAPLEKIKIMGEVSGKTLYFVCGSKNSINA